MREAIQNRRPCGRGILLVCLFVILSQSLDLWAWPYYPKLLTFITQHTVLAPFIFIACFSIGICFFLPAPAFLMIGGLAFGVKIGIVYNLCATALAMTYAFFITKTFCNTQSLKGKIEQKLQVLTQSVSPHDWKILIALRLNPLILGSLINYYFGLTGICFWFYLWISLLASLPMAMAYTFLGSVVHTFALNNASSLKTKYALLALALLLGALSCFYLIQRYRLKSNTK